MPRLKDVQPEDIHQRILDAALICFTQNGIKGSTTKAIAAEAKVSEMTLFRHFDTKQTLVDALFEPVIRAHRQMQQGTDLEQSLLDRLRFVRENRPVLRVLFNEGTSVDTNLIEVLIQDVKRQLATTPMTVPIEVAVRVISGIMLSTLVIPQDANVDHDVVKRVLQWLTQGKE